MCNKGIPLHNNSNLYNYSEWVKCLVGQNKAAVFSVTVTQCDGMRYNSAKNTSYIPNESVGMLILRRSTAQIAILCILVLLTLDTFVSLMALLCLGPDYQHTLFNRQKTDSQMFFVWFQPQKKMSQKNSKKF